MKRVLRYAAEHGYDRVTWDTGQTQADRYDLSKHIKEVRLQDNASGGVGRPRMDGPFEEGTVQAFDHNGRKVISQYVRSPDELPDLIGRRKTWQVAQRRTERNQRRRSRGSRTFAKRP